MASGFDKRQAAKVRRILRFAPESVTKPLKDNIARGARTLSLTVKRGVRRRTGQYRRLVKYKVARDGLSARIGLIGKRANRKAFYARVLESPRFQGGRFQTLEPAMRRHRDDIARRALRDVDQALDKLAQ